MESWAVPLAALVISIATFVASRISERRTAKRQDLIDVTSKTEKHEERIRQLEIEHEDCERRYGDALSRIVHLERALANSLLNKGKRT